jgi:hypothetical protein
LYWPQIKQLSCLLVCSLAGSGAWSHAEDGGGLLQSFQSPPKESRPTLWWRFMDDYVTREGITADLEFMQQVGLSGAVVSYCSSRTKLSNPQPGLPFVPILSKEWWDIMGFQLKEASARDLDLWFQACPGYATSGGPWITPETSMQKLVWSETACEGGKSVESVLPVPAVDKKWNFYRDIAVLAVPVSGDNEAIRPDQVINLTDRMDASGRLQWEPKAGAWNIVRLGHTTTGVPVHPVTKAGAGLECDKLSREAARVQFDQYFKKILDQRPARDQAPGKIELFYDSWEADNQNWTAHFREEFQKRRGYDPLPWLLVATGRMIGSEEMSRRFDGDWRTTIEEMINTEHFAELARLSHENGCGAFRGQPYNGPVNFMTAGAVFDMPEGEFWHVNRNYGWWTLRMIASVSHVQGRNLASAETLTASPEDLRFDVDPFSTKAETDLAFTMGINNLAIPHIPHNPWPKLKPGMTAGPYGMLLGGGQVWADLAGSWVTYLSRCCYLLQQGTFSADVVTLFRPGQRGFTPPAGYAVDLCNEERILSAMTWDGSALCLPGGMRYQVLELVDTTQVLAPQLSPSGIEKRLGTKPIPQNICLPLLRKVRELVLAGATVVGPRPATASGLTGYPGSDQEVARIAEELWGPASATGPVDRKVGKGRVFSRMPVAEVLARLGVQPDFSVAAGILPAVESGFQPGGKTVSRGEAPDNLNATKPSQANPGGRMPPSTSGRMPDATGDDLPWIHRRLGDDDWYFVSNQKNQRVKVTGSFRVDGKVPEFWHADTGLVEPVRSWTRKDGRTEVGLDFDPRGSVFVRFHPGPMPSLTVKLKEPSVIGSVPLSEGWKVRFAPGMGAPAEVEFPKLVSWTERPEKGIRYYSGIAVYEREAVIPAGLLKPGCNVVLDLGAVKNLARVTVNGTVFPELWKPPFTCDITQAVKPGVNKLSVEVVNVWANRLIGDEQEPADVQWGPDQFNPAKRYKGQSLEAFPGWMIQGTPRPSPERRTFTTWNYIVKEQPLQPSGLLGPAQVIISINPTEANLSPCGTTYFIDPVRGDDSQPGTSAGQAWKTMARINALKLAPRDRLVIAPGFHEGTLKPSGAGTAASPVVIQFLPGVHVIGGTNLTRLAMFVSNSCDSPAPKPIGILLQGVRHFRVEGGGVVGPGKTVILYDSRMVEIFNDHAENITFTGLVFDLKRPTVSEFRALEAGPTHAVIQVAEGSEYAVEGGKFLWKGDWLPGATCQEAIPEEGLCWRSRAPRGWDARGQSEAVGTDLGGRKIRLEYPGGDPGLTPGHQYHFRNTFRDSVGVHNARCKDIVFRDCDFYALTGMGFVSQFTENITYQRVNVAPPEGTLRTCAAWADVFQFSNCRGEIQVDSCRLSGMQDDAINCHGTHLRIVGQPAENQLRLRFMHKQTYGFAAFQPGDEVAVIHHSNLREYEGNPRRKVTDIQKVTDKDWIITLDAPVPAFAKDDVIDNITWHPNLTARNNHVSMDPVRGFLLTTRGRVVVENNTFLRPAMAGILVEDDAEGWFESGPVRDLLIRSNRFIRCGISINPHTRSDRPGEPVHENIRIENNVFAEGGGVSARSVKGLRVVNNLSPGGSVTVNVQACADAVVENNHGKSAE